MTVTMTGPHPSDLFIPSVATISSVQGCPTTPRVVWELISYRHVLSLWDVGGRGAGAMQVVFMRVSPMPVPIDIPFRNEAPCGVADLG